VMQGPAAGHNAQVTVECAAHDEHGRPDFCALQDRCSPAHAQLVDDVNVRSCFFELPHPDYTDLFAGWFYRKAPTRSLE